MSYTYSDRRVTVDQLIQRSRDMEAAAALRLLDEKCAKQEELLRKAYSFITSPKWGNITYMDNTVYRDSDALAEEIRTELGIVK